MSMRDYSVILAADLPRADDVLTLAKQVGKVVDGVKVAVATLLEGGTKILRQVKDVTEGRPLLVDLKVADIGFFSQGGWNGTNSKIIGRLKDSGATHVTVHGFTGPASVAEAVQSAHQSGIKVLLLPLMSHPGAGLFFSRPLNRTALVEEVERIDLDVCILPEALCSDVTDGILILGEALGVDGYIGPATKPEDLVRYRSKTSRPVWCPGFGRQDRLHRSLKEQFVDWARALGPSSAAIVGSSILGAPDRFAAAREVMDIRDEALTSV